MDFYQIWHILDDDLSFEADPEHTLNLVGTICPAVYHYYCFFSHICLFQQINDDDDDDVSLVYKSVSSKSAMRNDSRWYTTISSEVAAFVFVLKPKVTPSRCSNDTVKLGKPVRAQCVQTAGCNGKRSLAP